MVKHIHVPIPNQRSESATSHVVEEGAVRTALTFEREVMLERQREGIAKAKAEGKFKGRAPTARRKADEVKAMAQAWHD
jgi:DNA invertase Pin-like site-specific DNA recombinase